MKSLQKQTLYNKLHKVSVIGLIGLTMFGGAIITHRAYLFFTGIHIFFKRPRVQWKPFYGRKEGNVLFNDALNTFYLQLHGIRLMVKDHSDSKRGNPLPPHGLLFLISSKGSFIYIIPQT